MAPLTPAAVDEEQRQQATPLLTVVPVPISSRPLTDAPEVDQFATDHIVYDTALLSLPDDKKTLLLSLLAAGSSDIVVITTPTSTQEQLTLALTEAAGTPISAFKSPQLPAGTVSTLAAASYAPHRALLPSLLTAHNDNTQGFVASGISSGGVVIARGPDSTPTAVQWTIAQPAPAGDRVVTLLGYWRPVPDVVALVAPAPQSPQDADQRLQSVPLLQATPVSVVVQPPGQDPDVNPQAKTHVVYDTALLAMPITRKRTLQSLLASGQTDVVVIATPATTQAQLTAALVQAANGVAIDATKGAQLANGTTSAVDPASYARHRAVLPALLKAHNDNTLGFSNVQGGGVVVARAPDGTPTAVQWTLAGGKHVVTLLGYWRPGECLGGVHSAACMPACPCRPACMCAAIHDALCYGRPTAVHHYYSALLGAGTSVPPPLDCLSPAPHTRSHHCVHHAHRRRPHGRGPAPAGRASAVGCCPRDGHQRCSFRRRSRGQCSGA